MSDAPKPTAKSSMFQRAILLVCGLIGIVFGVIRMYQGVNEIIGSGEGPAVRKLLEESDQAIEDANKLTKDVNLLTSSEERDLLIISALE